MTRASPRYRVSGDDNRAAARVGACPTCGDGGALDGSAPFSLSPCAACAREGWTGAEGEDVLRAIGSRPAEAGHRNSRG